MKRILLLLLVFCMQIPAIASDNKPKWIKKESKALLSLTVYAKDGSESASGVAFFVSEQGDAVSSYTLFKDADKATVTDTEGQTYPVVSILGADELYDVVKFKVGDVKKVTCLPISTTSVPEGSAIYMMPYANGKEPPVKSGKIVEVSKLKDSYSYYKIDFPLEVGQVNSPLLNEEGEVFALAQEDASAKKEFTYGLSADYANSLTMNAMDYLNPLYQSIGIRKAWPQSLEDALVALYLVSSKESAKDYLLSLGDFIATFPQAPDGYTSRANHYAYKRYELADDESGRSEYLRMALDDMDKAFKLTDQKAANYYNKAKMIFEVCASDTTLTDKDWTTDIAMQTLQQAVQEEDKPFFHQLEGDIYFYQKQYEKAYDAYMIVNNSDMASGVTYYSAAKSKQAISGYNIGDILALMDSAVMKCGTPPSNEAAPYILERIELNNSLGRYQEVINDYDLYYKIMGGNVADLFYFYREQAKFKLGDLTGALDDIQQAISITPKNSDFYAEEASIHVRMQNYDLAIQSARKALAITPEFGACHRLIGVAYLRQKKNNEACEALHKAKEFGDPVADKLIKENCGSK